MRRLIISLLVLVGLLAILDRVAVVAAQHDVAERLQADAKLSAAPAVHIHGFPFLTQLIGGHYDDVDVVMHGLDTNGLRVDRLSVHVQGAHVSIGDVVSQNRSRIRIDHASAQVLLTYADLSSYLSQKTGTRFPAHLAQNNVRRAAVQNGDAVLLETSVGSVSVPLTGLPFGIHLTSAKATQAGVEVAGEATGLVLRT